MKYLLLLLMVGCASGQADNPQEEEERLGSVSSAAPITLRQEPIKVCDIFRSDHIAGCILYTAHCNDGNDDYLVRCPIYDMGELTNPPRPE